MPTGNLIFLIQVPLSLFAGVSFVSLRFQLSIQHLPFVLLIGSGYVTNECIG